jgi:hypothetical protein
MQVNHNNFLRWTDSTPSTDQPELPYAYVRDSGNAGFMPVFYPTEAVSFYINSETGATDYATFGDLKLQLVRAKDNTVAADSIGTLNQHTISGSDYNIYSTFVVPSAEDGIYYLQILRTASGVPLLTSSYVQVINNKTYLDETTVYVRFQHDRYFYGVKYHELTGFYQQFRLFMNVIEEQPESERELYKEVTTGKTRTFQSYLSWMVRLETYYLDRRAHKAAAVLFEHSYVEINGKQYVAKNTYKITPNPLSVYTKGEVELLDQEFEAIMRCGA